MLAMTSSLKSEVSYFLLYVGRRQFDAESCFLEHFIKLMCHCLPAGLVSSDVLVTKANYLSMPQKVLWTLIEAALAIDLCPPLPSAHMHSYLPTQTAEHTKGVYFMSLRNSICIF
jgi:hypothetical protein|uniref:Uncharacterized protein n=1 Tax=Mus musculus TaxID=10090 RepID=Q3UQF9_MOUSE|nr:unnamed protein product [Mus musculus]